MRKEFNLYSDISKRTDGDIYMGIVGPVRCGKSTFIKKFMEKMVIPSITDENAKVQAIDELPQSSDGKTIMTTEPKFVPKEAVEIRFGDESVGRIRMIDCVGYMVEGAMGHMEEDKARMVKTPWNEEPIPFIQAAKLGTQKVIREHSTIGIIISTDGSFGELKREHYQAAEKDIVLECKAMGKPCVFVLNTVRPQAAETMRLCEELETQYGLSVLAMDVLNLKEEDIDEIMERVLEDFPISQINFHLPSWVEMLPGNHWLKKELLDKIKEILRNIHTMKDITEHSFDIDSEYIKNIHLGEVKMENGEVNVHMSFLDQYYYEILSDMIGISLNNEYDLIRTLKTLATTKNEVSKISDACQKVKQKGYGIVTPTSEEIEIKEPELIKHGNKYGVKIKAICPSLHLIQANIETEIAPIVGNEQQANDLIDYIQEGTKDNTDGIFDTNIFGKTIRELVDDGINTKVNRLTDESQVKLQETIQKVINDSNGGLVCIII